MRTSDSLRIGDAERDAAIAALSRHFTDGRLTQFEYEERMSLALQARTGADLRALFVDLPRLDVAAPPARRRNSGLGFRRVVQPVVSALMVMSAVLLVLHVVPWIFLLALIFLTSRIVYAPRRMWCSRYDTSRYDTSRYDTSRYDTSRYDPRPPAHPEYGWRSDQPWRGGSGFFGR